MAHPPLSLLVLLLLDVHVSHGSPLPLSTYDGSMCSGSSMCGGVDIRYPFYLSNATQATPDYTSNYSCGYTDLKVFCEGEGDAKTPFLHLGEDTYTILDISYDNHTLVLGDADVLRAGNGCPRVSHNVSFSHDWLDYTDSLDSLAFFFDCYSKPGDNLPPEFPAGNHEINCKGPGGNGVGVSFVFISGSEEEVNASQEYQLAHHCDHIFVMPVHEDALMGSNPPVLPSEYGVVLKQGFELEWNTTQTCYPCERSGGRCAYSVSKIFLGCLCSDGKVHDQDCSSKFFRTDHSILFSSENKLAMVISRLPIAI